MRISNVFNLDALPPADISTAGKIPNIEFMVIHTTYFNCSTL
ncbi:hypothetical protein [[Scytonema hofmanni] UTEX B 1581]|nr:hypothetical protein [[Scytonema hofmanni] UTEX B 1581]